MSRSRRADMDLFGRLATRRLGQPTLRLRPRLPFQLPAEWAPEVRSESLGALPRTSRSRPADPSPDDDARDRPRWSNATRSRPTESLGLSDIEAQPRPQPETDQGTEPGRPPAARGPVRSQATSPSRVRDVTAAAASLEASGPPVAIAPTGVVAVGDASDSSSPPPRTIYVRPRTQVPDEGGPNAAHYPTSAARLSPGQPGPEADAARQPEVTVHIGRIELRAPEAAVPRVALPQARPKLSLEEYLESRHGTATR